MSSSSTKYCGTSGGLGPLPSDPDSNLILTVKPAFGGIDVLWTWPEINGHAVAYTIIYRSTNEDFATSVIHHRSSSDFFYDRVNPEQNIEYFYWVRWVSINGTEGELIGPASAIARPTIEQTIEMLTGQITASVLAQSLKEELQRIDGLNSDLGSEIAARLAQYDNIQADLSQFQNDVSGLATIIANDVQRLEDADTAQISQINVLGAKTESNEAMIIQESKTRADADSALAQTIETLQASSANKFYQDTPPDPAVVTLQEDDIWVDTSEPGDGTEPQYKMYQWDGAQWVEQTPNTLAGLHAAIEAEKIARITQDGALAERTNTLETSVGRKSRTYFQANPPALPENIGDLWIDTSNDNKLYYWEGPEIGWVDGWDKRIVTALDGVATADAKAVSAQQAADAAAALAQAEAQQAETEAKAYADGIVSTAEQAAIDAAKAYTDAQRIQTEAYADGIVTASEQAAIEAAEAYADQKKLEAQTYAEGQATAAQQAAIAAAKAYADQKKLEADAYADGVVTSAEADAIAAAKAYTDAQRALAEQVAAAYADGEVTAAEARAIAAAQEKADAAEAAASALARAAQADANIGKSRNQVFRQPTQPVAENVGDLWFDSDDGDKAYQWNGSKWQPLNLYTGNQVTATVEEYDRTRVGYCMINGSPDSSVDNRGACVTAGGTWLDMQSIAEAVKGVQITDGDGETANVEQRMQAYKDDIGNLNGQYTVKVQTDSNGKKYVGGFGLATQGQTVEAGFDVDRFWVGKLQPDGTIAGGTMPLIIEGNEVFIDQAAIAELNVQKLRSSDGNVMIDSNTGKFKAQYLEVDHLLGANGTFTGTLQIGLNSSGARLVMTNDVLKVYDSSNRLRVRIGDLTK